MKTVLILFIHILLNTTIGLAVLRCLGYKEIDKSKILQAIVVGILMETSFSFVLLWLGFSSFASLVLLSIISIILILYFQLFKKEKFTYNFIDKSIKFRWPDYLLVLLLLQKVISSLYLVIKMPLYFDDAMNHWSGRGRALFGEFNWSMEFKNPHLLAKQFGFDEYPFLASIWRANTANLNNGWNDILAKGDGFIFYCILIVAIYEFLRHFKSSRWIAFGSAFIASALPLQMLHSVSGYSEIIIEAISVVFLLSLVKKEWVVAGLAVGAMIFTKSEGLVLFFPLFTIAIVLMVFFSESESKVLPIAKYITASLVFVLPWIIFKLVNNVGFSPPLKAEDFYHSGAIEMFRECMFINPTNSIIWGVCLLSIMVGIKSIFRNRVLLIMCIILSGLIAGFIYVFCFTGAHIFLKNQMTIHRSLLQITPLAILIIALIAQDKIRDVSTN